MNSKASLTDIMTNRSDLRSYLAAQTRQVMAIKTCNLAKSCDVCQHRLPAVGTLPHGVYCAEHGCRVGIEIGTVIKHKDCER